MDAYVLIQTEPGLATTVMDSLVAGGVVDRAVAITGSHDLLARINDIEWEELTQRLLTRLQRTPGVVRSSTSVVVPEGRVAIGPRYPVFHRVARGEIHGLVFAKTASGTARDVAKRVRAVDGVLGLALLTGDHDLIIQVAGRSIDRLARTVLSQIQSIPGVVSTSTSLVLAATPLTTPEPRRRKTARRKTARRRKAAPRKPARRKAAVRKKPLRRKTAAKKKPVRRRRS